MSIRVVGMGGPHVLVCDDVRAIRRVLRTALGVHECLVYESASGGEAMQGIVTHRPDVMILDLGLPDMDGIEIIRRVREWSELPIIVLSVREQEQGKIDALDAGADDYLTKPFGTGELMARMRVALRRVSRTTREPVVEVDELQIDLGRRLVTAAGMEVQLTPTEYDLLRVLALNAGKVVTHHQLLREVWGMSYEGETHLLRVNISNLRHKIERDPNRPRYILTEPGVGYRLQA